jgi:signal transduction histidine kinase/CheY-like chemotaxis protein
MAERVKRTLRSKLLRITAPILLLLSVVTLASVAWVNYFTENTRLADIEHHIRASILSRGTTLTESHALALKSFVADNAFSDVRRLVARAIIQDEDVVYGAFLGADETVWAYVSPTALPIGRAARPPTKDGWRELGIPGATLRAPDLVQRTTTLFGKEIHEFAAPVVADDRERLGTVIYGVSNERLQKAVADARQTSRLALWRALATIAALALFAFGIGTLLVSRAAAKLTEPIEKLTAAANQIAQGERGLRVGIASGDEVEVLADAFNQMLEANEDAMQRLEVTTQRALEADRLKSEFLANMSHEIRTPMNGVLGMVKLMQTQQLDGRLLRYVEAIDRSANALLTIINDILDFSKLEAGKYSVQSLSFQPKLVVQEVAELLAARAHDKNIEIVYRTDRTLPTYVVGDPDRLAQVLNNLVGNAIKFTDKGEVFIDATVASRNADSLVLRVAVHDTGIGIDGADLPKLYDVFHQVDGSLARRHGGTGLGLAIAKRLVNMMGGDIQVESTVGQGTTFTFTVMLELDPRQQTDSLRPGTVAGKRALVVEGNRRWSEIIAEHLQAWRMECVVIDRGLQAVAKLQEAATANEPFDVIISGTNLDDVRVADLVKGIRAKSELKAVPIILLTTLKGGIALNDAERQGVTQIHKPIRFSELYNYLVSFSGNASRTDLAQPRPAIQEASNRKILVVDDNEINQFVAVEELELRGYRTDVAANGLEAIEKVKHDKFFAVLMDCQMPGMDGYTATAEIRKWEEKTRQPKPVPIIALTAHALAGEREKALHAGMDDYLSKPFRTSDLEKLLRIRADDSGEKPAVLPPASTSVRPQAVELSSGVRRSEKLIRLFVEKIPDQIDLLEQAVKAGAAADVRAHAHKLKGSCLAVAAAPMADVAGELQHAAEVGELGAASDMVSRLRGHHVKVEALLKEELAAITSASGSQGDRPTRPSAT